MEILSLAGIWNYTIDTGERGLFALPGSTCDNRIGRRQEYYTELNEQTVRAPREKYEYIGPLLLEREIEIPASWAGDDLTLFLERVNIASELFIDGRQIGRRIIELSAPHIYRINKITPGKHVMRIRVDNRDLVGLDGMASGYSIDTQGIWCGIIGRIELQRENPAHLENIQIYPQETGIEVNCTIVNRSGAKVSVDENRESGFVTVKLSVTNPDGKVLPAKTETVRLFTSRQPVRLFYEIKDIRWWNEFHPELYTLKMNLYQGGLSDGEAICSDHLESPDYSTDSVAKELSSCLTGTTTDEKELRFGMRLISIKNKQFHLNNRPISLRGTVDCAQDMLTGYPAMDKASWLHRLSIVKSYGLNHVRFHAWCPPEAAFAAADELGLYLSVEMPLWLNKDVCALEFGDDMAHRAYFPREAAAISRTYGNHPSFLFFSNGNEILGDFALLEEITTQIKALDPRRLYTLTSNFDHPISPCEDYLCAFSAYGNRVRLHDERLFQDTAESTCTDYAKAVTETPVPIISFEVGQYCVYPDVDCCEKFTGNMLPVNFDVIRQFMKEKNVYRLLPEYIRASGDLALKFYKEEIEAALRTEGFGGFELLSLTDYPGQCTATVGMLDAFFDGKGITTPEGFSSFVGSVVPLWKSRRVFEEGETLKAELALYDYGEEQLSPILYEVKIMTGGDIFYETVTRDSTLSIPLTGITAPAILKASVTVNSHTNTWNLYVMENLADTPFPECPVPILRADSYKLRRLIADGGRAIVTADGLADAIDGSFEPVFWSPAFFPSKKTCGMMIDHTHPVFRSFPTERYTDFQWREPVIHSKNMDTGSFLEDFTPIVEPVPNFYDNTRRSPLFEARVGRADILFCGFDLAGTDPASLQLKKSILEYVASGDFKPIQRLNKDVFSARA
ncbi:MAG: hypothetical protein LUE16_04235 [Lachnospiraceae bacterium]|nr:hypothetical protein [Lachnospiraceae bacterium]